MALTNVFSGKLSVTNKGVHLTPVFKAILSSKIVVVDTKFVGKHNLKHCWICQMELIVEYLTVKMDMI